MIHAQAMIQSSPITTDMDPAELADAIEVLIDCANTCVQCADACLAEGDPSLARCITLNLDCADVCGTVSRVVSRRTEADPALIRPLLEACVAACRACGDECGSHAEHMEHCAICAEQCRRCEEVCRGLLMTMAS